MSTKRAVLYARVSSDDRRKDGLNLKGQLDMGREYALKRGYVVVAELAEDDRGASGADFDLEKLNQALEMARKDEFEVLVVRELDRFARSLAKQLIIETEFKRAGVEIDYVLGEYPDTPEGNLNKNIKAVIAEYERLIIAERNVRGRRNRARAGHIVIHGKPPYGYRVVELDGKIALEVSEPEARIVRLMFSLYTQGDEKQGPLSLRAVTMRFTKMGISTPSGQKKWHRSTVSGMLKRETYAGVWHYAKARNGDILEHSIAVPVPAIVDREVWELAQQRREENAKNAPRTTK